MRHRGNNICLDKQTNKLDGRTAQKHNAFADIIGAMKV